MATPQELEDKFWQALKDDMTLMLGLVGVGDGHARPMTAQLEGKQGPIWFFTARDTELASHLHDGTGKPAFATFAAKDHDLFASIHGTLRRDDDRAAIDRLWNRFIAAWFEEGKEDPRLVLLRFEPERAEIWLDASSFLSGIKLLLGIDPKKDYRDKVAEVSLRHA